MRKKFFSWFLYKLMGWKTEIDVTFPDKFIMALAPHTSNWDFILGELFCLAENVRIGFMMKKEWFFWPLGPIFRKLGGIPVHREKNSSLTEAVAETAKAADKFALCITPEGTRKAASSWKKGFYYIALNAEIPILLISADYEKKLIRCTKQVIPSGDYDKDILEIRNYFKGCKGKHPEKFIDVE
ncbi:MAG: 1-acyl-sn-glycerol-3-phosphate acyltransferase [Bacteroidaceae bacterium]|nr:1-acyl-sn-glycerol-3-phosphate acyltransferase [Bacteroidaceae bacterium]